MSGERIAVRAFRALTRLYPRRFREEYASDMVSLFRDQCRDESTWRVFSRSAVDLAITIPTQHLEAKMRRTASPLVPVIYTAVAVAGLLVAIVGGTERAAVIIGLGLALGAGTVGALAWQRAAPVHATASGNWWKFLAAGPCLIASVIIAAGAGAQAWFLGVACLFTAFLLMAIGLVLGLAHLLNRRTRRIPT